MQAIDDVVASIRMIPHSTIDESFLANDSSIQAICSTHHPSQPLLPQSLIDRIRVSAFHDYVRLGRLIHPLTISPAYAYFLARYGGGFIRKTDETISLHGIGTLSEYIYDHILDAEGLAAYTIGYLPIGYMAQVGNPRTLIYDLANDNFFEIPDVQDLAQIAKHLDAKDRRWVLKIYGSFESLLFHLMQLP